MTTTTGEPADDQIALTTLVCPNCDMHVPVGEFCGVCGAHLSEHPAVHDPEGRAAGTYAGQRGPHRRHAFAAMPSEHVLSLRVLSTLFPHLPHRRTAPFRIGLVGLTVALVVLALLKLTGPAVLVAAAGVPLLFLLYLYEVEVYGDSPYSVVGLTLGLGAAVGVPFALLLDNAVSDAQLRLPLLGTQWHDVWYAGILLPVLAQAFMVLGTLILKFTHDFDEALDGFAFGAAGALGFVLGKTIADLEPEWRLGVRPDLRSTGDVVVEVVQRGLLVPFIAAATTGLLGAALWHRQAQDRAGRRRLLTRLEPTVFVVLGVDVGLGVLAVTSIHNDVVLPIELAAAAALLLWVRLVLHEMLLSEAVHVEIGPPEPCTHCHRLVPRMAFCPHCGIARRATPKAGAGRHGRTLPPATAALALAEEHRGEGASAGADAGPEEESP